jgi:hypothetical protein
MALAVNQSYFQLFQFTNMTQLPLEILGATILLPLIIDWANNQQENSVNIRSIESSVRKKYEENYRDHTDLPSPNVLNERFRKSGLPGKS